MEVHIPAARKLLLQMQVVNNILIISGFDATASAGILLDSHIAKILNVEPFCILPALSVQNHNIVQGHVHFSQEQITEQLENIHPLPQFAKIGLLQNSKAIIAVSKFFQKNSNIKIIADTPIISSSGKTLVDDIQQYIATFKKHLLPLVYLLTPNLDELQLFGTIPEILQTGCKNVLLKGGHSNDNNCIDTLYAHNLKKDFTLPRLDFKENIRGTGCGLSTVIACFLAQGFHLEVAIFKAKQFTFNGIKNSVKVNTATRVMKFI
jgi:hydroxymethylpyrimidine/phosphomethylpyrimidine kinase